MKRLILIGAVAFKAILFATTPVYGEEKQRELKLENRSTIESNVCIYQEPPKTSSPRVITVAWFCQPLPSLQSHQEGTSKLVFRWTEDYYFVWYQTGELGSKIRFTASQIVLANLYNLNEIRLNRNINGTYEFTDIKPGARPNILFIEQDRTIIPNEVFVGIGMAGNSIALVKALPNIRAWFQLEENPTYWIFLGNYQTGQELKLDTIAAYKQKIQFQGNIQSITAVLQNNNTWCIQPTGQNYCF